MKFFKKIKKNITEKWVNLGIFLAWLLFTLILGYLNATFPTYFSGRYGSYRYGDYWQQNGTTCDREVDRAFGIPDKATPKEREAAVEKVVDRLIKQYKENPETSVLRPIQKKQS